MNLKKRKSHNLLIRYDHSAGTYMQLLQPVLMSARVFAWGYFFFIFKNRNFESGLHATIYLL